MKGFHKSWRLPQPRIGHYPDALPLFWCGTCKKLYKARVTPEQCRQVACGALILKCRSCDDVLVRREISGDLLQQ